VPLAIVELRRGNKIMFLEKPGIAYLVYSTAFDELYSPYVAVRSLRYLGAKGMILFTLIKPLERWSDIELIK
jgi:hypothetical protein